MYALFTAIPLVGHLNPLIYQAMELQRRGCRVAVAGPSEMSPHVKAEAPEIPFIDLGPLGDIAGELRRREAAASIDPNFVRGTLNILDGLTLVWPLMFKGLASAIASDRPDVMVIDMFTSAGLSIARHLRIPYVVNNPDLLGALPVTWLPPADHLPFLFSGQSRAQVSSLQRFYGPIVRRAAAIGAQLTVGRQLNRLRAAESLPAIAVDALVKDQTVLVNGVFGLEYERPLPHGVEMVGPMLPPQRQPLPDDMASWLSDGDPVVYCNLGTLAVAPDQLLREILNALDMAGRRALWILKRAQFNRLPANRPQSVRILDWGPPPLSVLAHSNVKAFVSHCGINSVHEAIVAGTPIVGIPMFADQRDQAVRVADAGVGEWIDKRQVSASAIRAALDRVIADPAIPNRIREIQAAIARAGGVSRAADLIEQRLRAR